jgi:hypothetical protein
MTDEMDNAAIELDRWLRFAGCEHLGYIAVAVGIENPGDDIGLLVYWDKTRMVPGGMPETFSGLPLKLKRIGRPMPATS